MILSIVAGVTAGMSFGCESDRIECMDSYPITTREQLAAAALAVRDDLAQNGTPHEAAVIGLSGDLGVGKTTFVQTLAEVLGVGESVTSPTFTIMKRYTTADGVFPTLVHIDAYRVESIDEMRVLGFETLLAERGTLVCIEWPERIEPLLPQYTRRYTIALGPGEDRTLIQLS